MANRLTARTAITTAALVGAAVTSLVATSGISSSQTGDKKTAPKAVQKAAEQYEKVDVDALSIQLVTEIKSVMRSADGSVTVDGTVSTFTVAGRSVDLVTDKLGKDSNPKFSTVSTKFGVVRVTVGQFGGGTVWLKPSQKEALIKFGRAK